MGGGVFGGGGRGLGRWGGGGSGGTCILYLSIQYVSFRLQTYSDDYFLHTGTGNIHPLHTIVQAGTLILLVFLITILDRLASEIGT